MWTTQFLQLYGRRQMLTSGGLGTMGYGLGAAIGAQIGNPDKQVINIAGDGCFVNLTVRPPVWMEAVKGSTERQEGIRV